MDVVWMAKFKSFELLISNKKGQSLIEYLLLMAALSALGYALYGNARFREFTKGNSGVFATMRKGMAYSYRTGRNYDNTVQYEEQMSFDYQTNQHDLYLGADGKESRFFTGAEAYPQ